jgi:hypothetical protein
MVMFSKFHRNIDKLKKIIGGFFEPYQHSCLSFFCGKKRVYAPG